MKIHIYGYNKEEDLLEEEIELPEDGSIITSKHKYAYLGIIPPSDRPDYIIKIPSWLFNYG